MPVKKRKPTKKSSSKKIKKEVKKAVEKIPGMFVEHMLLDQAEKNKPTKNNLVVNTPPTKAELPPIEVPQNLFIPRTTKREEIISEYSSQRQKKLWLWGGVIILGLVVFGMWGWNAYVMFDDINKSKQETSLLKDTSKDFQKIMSDVEGEKQIPNLDELKNNLKKIISQIPATTTVDITTSTTSTPDMLGTTSTTTTTEIVFPVSENKKNN